MAPLEDEPPSAESYSEEEEDTEQRQEEDPSEHDGEDEEVEEEEDPSIHEDESDNDEPVNKVQPEPESDSDSTDFTVKKKNSSPPPKPTSKSVPKHKDDKPAHPKKQKKPAVEVEVEEEYEDEEEEKKGSAIVRKWSLTDEISVLQGLIDYKKATGRDPLGNQDEFYNYVAKKLDVGFSKSQVKDKLRRLKRKYKKYLSKAVVDGEDPVLSDPHDIKSFQLGKAIWGRLDAKAGNSNVNSKAKVNSNSNAKANASGNVVALAVQDAGNGHSNNVKKSGKRSRTVEKKVAAEEDDLMEEDEEDEKNKGVVGRKGGVNEEGKEKDLSRAYPHLMKAFENDGESRMRLSGDVRGCLSIADKAELEEWDRKWKKVRVAETEAYIKRIALIHEQTSWFANLLNSSKF